MISLELAVLIVASVANLLIGLFAFSKDWRNVTNMVFVLLTITLVGWTSFNHISITSTDPDLTFFAVKALLIFVVLQNTLFMLFVSAFPINALRIHKVLLTAFLLFSLVTIAAGLTAGFFSGYTIDGTSIKPNPGPAIGLFVIHTLFSIGWGMARLYRRFKNARGMIREQYKFLILAGSVLLLLTPLTNFLMPVAFDINFFLPFAPLYTFMFAVLIAYAMFKHRLLDIRMLVARSATYILLITTLVLVYFGLVFGVATLLFNDQSEFIHDIFPLISALFLVATAPILKGIFDRVTNDIFYHDGYDPQTFLDQLNKTLVGNIEIGILLRHTAAVIEQNLKAECHIYVKETDTTPARIMGTSNMNLKSHNLDIIKKELSTIPHKTVVTDELEEHYADLRQALSVSNIAMTSSLITNYSSSHEATAYLFLGPKKSGSTYNKQDKRIINIITDELLIAIQNALRFEEIQSFNITLQNRINDATNKLKRSNEKLREMDETKDEFISMASHQLRTPLTSVKGYLSMVLDGDAGKVPEGQSELLNQAYVSAQRMVYLIADLLNVSRLKTGKFVIQRTPTNLADMVESEIAQLNEVAKSHKLTLNYHKPEDFPVLMLDETKTRQVVMNFVDNAIYYTPSGGRIKIELDTDRSSVYFMVKDDGMGVPKADQPHLFTKFYRAKNAQKARPDGTGLGLFMAKKVITEQGGTILFESNENKGSTFGFKFDRPKEGENLEKDENNDEESETSDNNNDD